MMKQHMFELDYKQKNILFYSSAYEILILGMCILA
jgi:hypothetical protein